jgi:hypothetical protein
VRAQQPAMQRRHHVAARLGTVRDLAKFSVCACDEDNGLALAGLGQRSTGCKIAFLPPD